MEGKGVMEGTWGMEGEKHQAWRSTMEDLEPMEYLESMEMELGATKEWMEYMESMEMELGVTMEHGEWRTVMELGVIMEGRVGMELGTRMEGMEGLWVQKWMEAVGWRSWEVNLDAGRTL